MMRLPLPIVTAAVLLAAACGGGDQDYVGPRQLPESAGPHETLIRLPASGDGTARLYTGDSLIPLDWSISGGVPAVERALTFDRDDLMLYVVTAQGDLVGVDLRAQKAIRYLRGLPEAGGSQDGLVVAVDSSHRPLRFASRSANRFRMSVGASGRLEPVRLQRNRIGIYDPDGGTFQVLDQDQEVRRFPVPAGQLASTRFGELIAITNDSGVTMVNVNSDTGVSFLRIRRQPIASTFSASGHRLYVARAAEDILVIDRFSRQDLRSIELPGVPAAVRADPSGRWLLAKSATGNQVWVIDLVRHEVTGTVDAPWGADLPIVTNGRTLVARTGADLQTWDLLGPRPTGLTRLAGAAGDIYAAVPWSPRADAGPAQVREVAEVVESDVPAEPAAAASSGRPTGATETGDLPSPTTPSSGAIYVQVTATQNLGWAQAFAKSLVDIGFPARVLEGRESNGGYRVVVGPYSTRDDADAVGKRLGHSYFLLTLDD